MSWIARSEPYQWMFPIGALAAILGSALWIFYGMGLVSYPSASHSSAMMVGFLTPFAVGFLMTAIPRFTGTETARRSELYSAFFLCLGGLMLSLLSPESHLMQIWIILIYGFLVFYGTRRFLKRVQNPPPSFLFLPVGLILAISGSILLLMGHAWEGRVLYYHGTLLAFVLGIGSRLIGAILGHPLSPISRSAPFSIAMSGLYLGGFALRALGHRNIGFFLIASVVTSVAFVNWKIHRFPVNRTKLCTSLWVSAWCTWLGVLGTALLPRYEIHIAHLTFIGGLGLMTLGIASRVTLAHGDGDLTREQQNFPYVYVLTLIILAGLIRIFAPLQAHYTLALSAAAGLWICAVVIWSGTFIPKMASTTEVEPGCS